MPNPQPQQGLKGCRPIVDVWRDLSNEDDLSARADDLEQFYFDGHGNVPPVVLPEHLGDNADDLGQIRTNQFIQTDTGWSVREYKLRSTCDAAGCSRMTVVPVTNKTNPFGGLFDPASTHPLAPAFRSFFPTIVEGLAGDSLATISMSIPDEFNTAQSQSSSDTAIEMKYLEQLGPDPSELRTAVEGALDAIDSDLTVDDIVQRAQAMTCAGCHRLSRNAPLGGGLVWPADIGFVHVSERFTEEVDGELRFDISDALKNEFLPQRKQLMEDFLNDKPMPPPAQGPKAPIGGRDAHG